MASTTSVHHSPCFLFQDQDIRGQSHSRRPHLTNNPSIINTHHILTRGKDLKAHLREFQRVFTWSLEDVPKIDPKLAKQHIPEFPHMKLVKQKICCL